MDLWILILIAGAGGGLLILNGFNRAKSGADALLGAYDRVLLEGRKRDEDGEEDEEIKGNTRKPARKK